MDLKQVSFRPDHVPDYFKKEWFVLFLVTVSGLIYNFGLLAGPWFEGQMAECLTEILKGTGQFSAMEKLVICYVLTILVVQVSRYIKRFYVRRFANNVNRRMKHVLYANLIHQSRAELEQEGTGDLITKAISDVDDCAEGMRKFTTEVFDTGVAMICYIGMLLGYDWRLALLCLIFPPVSYILAEKMKTLVQKTGADYKKKYAALSAATLDRAQNAITYRVYGCEPQREHAYEEQLKLYEKSAIRANIWATALPPLYQVISMLSILFFLYFGVRNVLHTGWTTWDIAAFTTFLSCYTKLSVKSSKAAKLFNSVHKAEVSWKRIKPLMKTQPADQEVENVPAATLSARNLSFAYPNGKAIFSNAEFSVKPGEIVGITGPVACGKSTLGKVFLCEYPYEGSIRYGSQELKNIPEEMRRGIISYLGHDPELLTAGIRSNILMEHGLKPDEAETEAFKWLKRVFLDREVSEMPEKAETLVGSGGVRLSGGQAQRLALARTLKHRKPLMILDDPFSALDRETEEKIFAGLRKNKDGNDGAILLISHRLYLFPQMDQVIWMDQGEVVTGTHESLMQTVPEYAALYRAQTEDADVKISVMGTDMVDQVTDTGMTDSVAGKDMDDPVAGAGMADSVTDTACGCLDIKNSFEKFPDNQSIGFKPNGGVDNAPDNAPDNISQDKNCISSENRTDISGHSTVSDILLKTLVHQKLLSLLVLIAVAGAVISSLLPPLVLARIIDRLADTQFVSFDLSLLYFLLLALTGILESSRESLLTVLGQKITHALRTGLSEKLSRLPAKTLNIQDAGAVSSRFVGDVDTIENLFTSGIISMLSDGVKIISILWIIFKENKGLALVLLPVLPIVFAFTRLVQKNMLKAHVSNRAAISRVTSHVPETIRCIRTIHTLNKEKYMEDTYDKYINESYRAIEKTNFYDAVYSPVILILNAVVVAIVMLLSASNNPMVLTFFGMSVGTAVAVINYISQIFSPIESLGMEIQTIQSALAGVKRIDEFLNLRETEIKVNAGTQGNMKTVHTQEYVNPLDLQDKSRSENISDAEISLYKENRNIVSESSSCMTQRNIVPYPEIAVSLHDVVFGYDDHPVLNHLSFDIETGEQVTLQGRTGAGKSTIFKLLLGLYQVQSGSVRILGRDAGEIKDEERRKVFGYVEQNFHMIPGTIRDQITLMDDRITKEMTEDAARLSGLDDTIRSLEQGYDTLCTPSLLSQGQWQLLSIARAVAADPKILLLDEITANLDAATEEAVLNAISNASAGRTVISISHRIYRHTEGRVIEIG